MCAALSSYVHACAARGISLDGWRDDACSELLSSQKGLRIFDILILIFDSLTSCFGILLKKSC